MGHLTKLLAAAILFSAFSAQATTISLITLPEGATIMQVTRALSGPTDGGIATSDTRTLYYFAPDFGDAQINFHDFAGTTWPYVYLTGGLNVDPNISADISTANDSFGEFLLINGNPVYQFINDNNPRDATGNFGPWNFILSDGSPTQSVSAVPVPAALPLLLSALAGMRLVTGRRRSVNP